MTDTINAYLESLVPVGRASDAAGTLEQSLGSPDSADIEQQALLGAQTEHRGIPKGHEIIVLPEKCTPAQMVYILSAKVPLNTYGLPIFIYRSDLLAAALPQGYITQNAADAAALGLFYHDGYPTFENGQSFWGRMSHEPLEAYLLFQAYLEQAETLGIRQLDLLAASQGGLDGLQRIKELSMEFYWGMRAKAYDIFCEAAEQKRRSIVIRKTENRHFDHSEAIMARLMEKFEDPDWIDELNAKEAIEALETLVKVQRLSLGLTGQHASSSNGRQAPAGASGEYIIRQLVRGASVGEGGATDAFSSKMQELLADDSAGLMLQEMILRVNGNNMSDDGRVLNAQMLEDM